MTVKATVKTAFYDQGILFPEGAVFEGSRTEDGTVIFLPGAVSSKRHEISIVHFSSLEEVRIFQARDEDEDIRRNLPKVYVTPKEVFEDQGIRFVPSEQILGYLDMTNEQVCFPTGSVSIHRHKFSFTRFSENLKAVYSPSPDPNQAGA